MALLHILNNQAGKSLAQSTFCRGPESGSQHPLGFHRHGTHIHRTPYPAILQNKTLKITSRLIYSIFINATVGKTPSG